MYRVESQRTCAFWRASVLGAADALIFLPAGAALAKKKIKPAPTANPQRENRAYCSQTSAALFAACKHELQDDFQVARAVCINTLDPIEREACAEDSHEALAEGAQECAEVRDAREDVCDLVGQARYEPDFDPADYDDPRQPTNPNPYQPLAVGNHWVVSDGDEQVDIEVLDKVKLIEGVLCLVVSDIVSENGAPLEITDDWFAQRKDGGVAYCGEQTAEYETFPGDDPQEAELTSTDGAFKHGRDGSKAGLLFMGTPRVGDSYRQEWSPSNAEDTATVLSTSYGYGQNAALDAAVPQALAQLLCSANDCVVTAEFSALSPGGLEHKYYARGIGFFLATNPNRPGSSVEQLVGCNFDARCASLPQP